MFRIPFSHILSIGCTFGGSAFHQKYSLLLEGNDIAIREEQEKSPLMEVYI